jgi:hypothetical protein
MNFQILPTTTIAGVEIMPVVISGVSVPLVKNQSTLNPILDNIQGKIGNRIGKIFSVSEISQYELGSPERAAYYLLKMIMQDDSENLTLPSGGYLYLFDK